MNREPVPPLAPVFPLPNCVLFPKVLQPLRIFEPRYKKMLADMLDSQGWLAIGLLRSERERDEEGRPDVFPIVGLGRLIDYEQAEDDTFKILLIGEYRVRVRSWLQVEPYPIGQLEHLPEPQPDDVAADEIRGRLRARIKDLVRKSVDSAVLMLLDRTIKECEEVGSLVDLIAYHFLTDPYEKQRLLETVDAEERERLLIETLENVRIGESPSAPSLKEFDE